MIRKCTHICFIKQKNENKLKISIYFNKQTAAVAYHFLSWILSTVKLYWNITVWTKIWIWQQIIANTILHCKCLKNAFPYFIVYNIIQSDTFYRLMHCQSNLLYQVSMLFITVITSIKWTNVSLTFIVFMLWILFYLDQKRNQLCLYFSVTV